MRKFALLMIIAILSFTGLASAQKVLTLPDCIDTALKNNWTYRSAVWSNKSAGNDLWSAWGRFMPRVDFSLSNNFSKLGPATYTDPFTGLRRVDTLNSKIRSYSAGVQVSQVIFDGGANLFNLSSKLSAKNSSDYSLLFNKQNLIFQVKQAYYDLLRAKMLLEVQREVVKRGEQQLKIAQSRYELGSASKSDFLKAKVQFGQDQLALVKAENQVKVAQASLNAVIGQKVDEEFEVQEVLEQPQMNLSYGESVNLAYKNHPSIKQTDSDLDVAEANTKQARAGYFPTVSLDGSYSWRGYPLNGIDNYRDRDYRWGVGLSVSFNLFEGFATRTSYLNARNLVKIAKEKVEQTKSDVAFEVKQAFLAIEENQKSISVTQENVSSAEEDLNLVQEKYRLGAASILELLDAQVSFQTAKSDNVQALFDYNLAVARLERAIGK
jgi:TolC family type I secretion outer membrane protein